MGPHSWGQPASPLALKELVRECSQTSPHVMTNRLHGQLSSPIIHSNEKWSCKVAIHVRLILRCN